MEVLPRRPAEAVEQADTVALALFEGEGTPPQAPEAAAGLVASGEAREEPGSVAVTHADGRRWLLVGVGPRAELTGERARVAAAAAASRAREISTRALCWLVPEGAGEAIAAALVEGTVLADYRFERFKSAPPGDSPAGLERLLVGCPEELAGAAGDAAVVAARVNRARDLQNRPGNDLTPTALGEHARALAGEIPALTVEVEGRDAIRARGMGAFSAVAQGSAQEPALITMRYEPSSAGPGAVLSFVGKAVTFDSGGISLKPAAKMSEMKFDMSGGAAAIEATAAIAALGLPLRLLTVVGATENLPERLGGQAGRHRHSRQRQDDRDQQHGRRGPPRARRLPLSRRRRGGDAHRRSRDSDRGRDRGARQHLRGTHQQRRRVRRRQVANAGDASGEILWRLPLHEEYDESIKGSFADLDNAPEARKAGAIVAGAFLSNFVGETPWAHLDIAGTAWDLGRPYVGKGASGFGVRLLVELARELAV